MGLVGIDTAYLLAGLRQYGSSPEIDALIQRVGHGPFTLGKVRAALDLITLAVGQVEKIATDVGEIGAGTGEAKREAVIHWLDEAVKLPALVEFADGPLIGKLVDSLVDELNKTHPEGWVDKIKEYLK